MNNSTSALSALRVVMVETTLTANIGSAARAMMTCNIHNLAVVNPKNPIDEISYAYAKGGKSILERAVIYPDLPSALADCSLVIASSSRTRHIPRPMLDIDEACVLIDQLTTNQELPKIALVFGREDRGLTNDELSLADYHLQLNANPDYPVLNVASSVQVIGSFLYHYFRKKGHLTAENHNSIINITHRQYWDTPAITHSQKKALEAQFITLLSKLNLAEQSDLKELPSRIARLSSRLQLDQKEYALMMALLATLFKRL